MTLSGNYPGTYPHHSVAGEAFITFIQNTRSRAVTVSPLDHFHGFSFIVTVLPPFENVGWLATE